MEDEMAIDMKDYEQQIQMLEQMKVAIQGAIDRARERIDLIQNKNEPFEKVFETDRKPNRRL
jgi:hypothetical protein